MDLFEDIRGWFWKGWLTFSEGCKVQYNHVPGFYLTRGIPRHIVQAVSDHIDVFFDLLFVLLRDVILGARRIVVRVSALLKDWDLQSILPTSNAFENFTFVGSETTENKEKICKGLPFRWLFHLWVFNLSRVDYFTWAQRKRGLWVLNQPRDQ